VAIRPEDIRVQAAGQGPRQNVLACVVQNSMFLGAECEVLVEVGERTYTLSLPRSLTPEMRPGECVDLRLPAEQVRLWPTEPRHSAAAVPDGLTGRPDVAELSGRPVAPTH
jgi:hypothetical protein